MEEGPVPRTPEPPASAPGKGDLLVIQKAKKYAIGAAMAGIVATPVMTATAAHAGSVDPIGPPTAAQIAGTHGSVKDARGDVARPDADLVRVSATDGKHQLRASARFARLDGSALKDLRFTFKTGGFTLVEVAPGMGADVMPGGPKMDQWNKAWTMRRVLYRATVTDVRGSTAKVRLVRTYGEVAKDSPNKPRDGYTPVEELPCDATARVDAGTNTVSVVVPHRCAGPAGGHAIEGARVSARSTVAGEGASAVSDQTGATKRLWRLPFLERIAR